MAKRYVSTGEAAEYLGITRNTLHRWVHDGLVAPAFRTPRRGDMRWDLNDLDRQLTSTTPAIDQPTAPQTPHMAASKPQQPAVIAAIVTSRLGVLAVQRRDQTPPWSFPAGESEPGESPADTIVREVKEETGLLIKPGRIIAERIHPKTRRHLVYVAAIPATHNRDVFVGDDQELSDVRWLTRTEAEHAMPDMDAHVHQHLTQRMTGPSRGKRQAEQLPYEAAS
jgi:excisionase family DNA binding protein